MITRTSLLQRTCLDLKGITHVQDPVARDGLHDDRMAELQRHRAAYFYRSVRKKADVLKLMSEAVINDTLHHFSARCPRGMRPAYLTREDKRCKSLVQADYQQDSSVGHAPPPSCDLRYRSRWQHLGPTSDQSTDARPHSTPMCRFPRPLHLQGLGFHDLVR